MKKIFGFTMVLLWALAAQAQTLLFVVDPTGLDSVECWDEQTCQLSVASIVISVLDVTVAVPLLVQEPGDSGWPGGGYALYFDAEEFAPGAMLFELHSVSLHFTGPSFSYLVQQAVDPPITIMIYPLPGFLPLIVEIPPGDGCVEEAGAQEAELAFELKHAYPNPCNGSAILEYSLPQTMEAELAVYNLQGERMITLATGLQNAGLHQLRLVMDRWPTGLYLCRLQSGSEIQTRRLVLLR